MTEIQIDQSGFVSLVEGMSSSISATRESIRKILTQLDTDTKDGISLLSLKHHIMLSYLQSLVLLSAHRVVGHTLVDRSSTNQQQPFSTAERAPRGSQPGDLVDSMVENRIVLEKVKALESKMKYQIEKLVRLAEESPADAGNDAINDPLAFRPNPQNLMNQDAEGSGSSEDADVAPMPYTEESGRSKKERRKPVPIALTQLGHLDPHVETTSGLGGVPALESARAKELARMTGFEEENFTRLVMKKKDAKRRQRDEEDIALGGTGAGSGSGVMGRGRRGMGLDDEFADVLKSVGRRRDGAVGDGYEELRQRGKKSDALSRSRSRNWDDIEGEEGPRRKKGKFERDQAAVKKVLKRKMKR
ncbi:hypothetical protein EW145_g1626 [Phellinidium pouzarii]|uniref:Neuroguidin n=1 Tax=Phellinidium pouzarii TaxID=167371 RepID=A0A4S4LEC2_9AGAM|nr:hypothetical protein EW145_g1626 [Phellinidium pouzarii]